MARLAIWVASLMTIALWSTLFSNENPVYKIAEYIYVGVGVGYGVGVTYHTYLRPTLMIDIAQKGNWGLIVPVVLGLMMYTKFSKTYSYLSRWTVAFFLGVGSGIVLTRDFKAYLLNQVQATFQPLFVPGNLAATVNNVLLVVGVASTLSFFIFARKQVGVLKVGATIGRYTMMVAFGAAFATSVMARAAVLMGRMQGLLGDWLGLIK